MSFGALLAFRTRARAKAFLDSAAASANDAAVAAA